MAWVKLDDQAPRHEKMLKAGPAACWLWVCGIAHCQSQLTDGIILDHVLSMIGIAGRARCVRLANHLVRAGLFERIRGGYKVHDYLGHNASKIDVLAKRAEDSERKRQGSSKRSPRGIQTESSRPIPSHPIPSVLPTEVLPGFEQFWATYPKHSGRKDCEAFWARLAPSETLAAKILRGAAAYARHVKDWKPDFIKAPIRWLEGAHWDDELGGPAPKPDAGNCSHQPKCADAWAHQRLVDAEASGDLELVASVRRLNAKAVRA